MAKASLTLIQALRNTAEALQKGNQYQWGHMGSCNCGHLAQELTKLTKKEIHMRAMQKHGDWNEQLNDYCPTSGLLMDDLITQLVSEGLGLDDLRHLERLSDQEILRTLPLESRYLSHNKKEDVIIYLHIWANLLETKFLSEIKLPEMTDEVVTVL